MRTPITFAQLQQKIRDLAETNPAYIYPAKNRPAGFTGRFHNCVYRTNGATGQPACIFGQAFAELGYPVPVELEGNPISELLYVLLADVATMQPKDFTWAQDVQSKQDRGTPWANAVAHADYNRANSLYSRR